MEVDIFCALCAFPAVKCVQVVSVWRRLQASGQEEECRPFTQFLCVGQCENECGDRNEVKGRLCLLLVWNKNN